MAPLLVNPDRLRYHALLATGGIGTGSFFALNGDHTLGREESRTGRFLHNRDYAKLHIVAHYVQSLMGPPFKVLPIGRVGADEPGQRLLQEMASAGLDLRYVRALDDACTMNCICLLYPDGSGGNLTVSESACTRVDPATIHEARPDFAAFDGHGIALAAPEVPLEARAELLELATRHRFFRAGSFTPEEMHIALGLGLFSKLDLLVINRDEAAAFVDVSDSESPDHVAAGAVEALRRLHPALSVVVTAGSQGSWAWDGTRATHCHAYEVDAVSAAGAGDAFLAGVLIGLASDLSLADAQHLGALTSALAVTSPHTINPDIDRESLAAFAENGLACLADSVRRLLGLSPCGEKRPRDGRTSRGELGWKEGGKRE